MSDLVSFIAPIYLALYGITITLSIAHLYLLLSRRQQNSDTSSQAGFKKDLFGTVLQTLTGLFIFFLNVILVLACVGKLSSSWLLGPEPEEIQPDSFDYIFLITVSICSTVLLLLRRFRRRLTTLYLRPSPFLAASDFVLVDQELHKVEHLTADDYLSPRHSSQHPVQTEHIKIQSTDSIPHRDTVSDLNSPLDSAVVRFITVGGCRWVYDSGKEFFCPPAPLWEGTPSVSEILAYRSGLSSVQAREYSCLFGPNYYSTSGTGSSAFTWLEYPFDFAYFSIYQYISFWFLTFSGYLALVLMQLSIILIFRFRDGKILSKRRSCSEDAIMLQVIRDGRLKEIRSQSLVPGDVVLIKRGLVQFDGVLVSGGSVIVDDAVLSGKSLPIIKGPVHSQLSHVIPVLNLIEAGSVIVAHGEGTFAVVTATGATTVRGECLSGDVREKKGDALEDRVNMNLLGVVAVVIITLTTVYGRLDVVEELMNGLTTTVILVNPLLAIARLGSGVYAAESLKRKRIHVNCIESLHLVGKIDTVIFDKVNTLTESMKLDSVVLTPQLSAREHLPPTDEKEAKKLLSSKDEKDEEIERRTRDTNIPDHLMNITMGCCHSVAMDAVGDLQGDGLEMEMVRAVLSRGWKFVTSDFHCTAPVVMCPEGVEYRVTRVVPFTNQSACMRVFVTSSAGQSFEVVKGAWATVKDLVSEADKEKWASEVVRLSSEGYYVLTVAGRRVLKTPESMGIVGLVLYEAHLKNEAVEVVKMLLQRKKEVLIVTGDSKRAGRATARDLGLSEEVVEGRATAERKLEIVDRLEEAGRHVLVVGDGANDCKAFMRATASLAIGGDNDVSRCASLNTDRHDLKSVLDALDQGESCLSAMVDSVRFGCMAGVLNACSRSYYYLFYGEVFEGINCVFMDILLIPTLLWALTKGSSGRGGIERFPALNAIALYLWSLVSLGGTLSVLLSVVMNSEWFTGSSYAVKSRSYAFMLIFIWLGWAVVDLSLCYSTTWRNWRLWIAATSFYGFLCFLLFNQSSSVACIFSVNCIEENPVSVDHWIYHVFVRDEQGTGGKSNALPLYSKFLIFGCLCLMSAVHLSGAAVISSLLHKP